MTAQELLEKDSTDRVPAPIEHEAPEASEEAPRKSARIDPDALGSEPSTKQSSLASIIGVGVVGRMARRLMSK